MREEITEPRHWRSSRSSSVGNSSRSATNRRTDVLLNQPTIPLEPNAVDEAFALEAGEVTNMRGSRREGSSADGTQSAADRPLFSKDIIDSLSQQLAMLEVQREQLARLLDEARG